MFLQFLPNLSQWMEGSEPEVEETVLECGSKKLTHSYFKT